MDDRAAVTRCAVCGGKIEDPNASSPCFGCRLDAWLPRGYDRREDYEYCAADGLSRARRRPKTGRAILDARPPVRAGEAAMHMTRAALLIRAERERSEGLGDDF
jgi:hypothetical protein